MSKSFVALMLAAGLVLVGSSYAEWIGGTKGWKVAGDTLYTNANERIGFGTQSPDERLHVVGNIKMVDGNQGADKVLTSDANGVASWQPAPGVPSGTIVMFWGTSVPLGWHLCNGGTYMTKNGKIVTTPDLRDRFIYGKTVVDQIIEKGGSSSHNHTYSDLPQHNHSVDPPNTNTNTTGAHTHSHTLYVRTADGIYSGLRYQGKTQTTLQFTTGSAGDHKHSVNIGPFTSGSTGDVSCSTASASSLPPYYKLAFIMKL